MVTILNRTELDEAIRCFMAKRGYALVNMKTTISSKMARIEHELNEPKEDNKHSSFEGTKQEVEEPIVTEPEPTVQLAAIGSVKSAPTVEDPFGTVNEPDSIYGFGN